MDIRLLGLVEASHEGNPVLLGGAKVRALLAILALHANAPVSADRLIEGLWGDRPPATAPKLVQVLVSQLRKQLAGVDAEIITRGRGYELRVDPDDVDALRFERLLAGGRRDADVLEALALWRGPPLDDLADEPFAAPEIRRLEDLWLEAREAVIDAALEDGRSTSLLPEIDALVREHPLRERPHGQRMLALYRSGRQADALEAFRQARRLLVDEVGLEPGPGLRGLNEAILRQDPALDGPPARLRRRPPTGRPLLLAATAAAAIVVALTLAATQHGGPGGLTRIGEDATGVIDPGSGRIVAQYAVGHAPNALVAGAGSVWSANSRDGTVSRIDRRRGQVTTIDVGGEPTAVAFGGGSLWVADGDNRRVAQIDSATNRVVRRLPAGNAPRGVAVGGGAVWLTSAVDGQVERLDLASGGRLARTDIPGGPASIAVGGGGVWVAGEEDGVVTRLDAHSGAALKAIGVGNGPVAIAAGYGAVWVANRDDGTVTRIDARTDAVTDTVQVGGTPVAIAAGLGGIWVADGDAGAVVRIDPQTRGVSRRIALGSAPTALTVADGSVWAAASVSRATHRGGTLRFASAPFDDCGCIDPAGYDPHSWPVLSLAYDGLVAYRRIPGVGGSTIVPDLAVSVPPPSADGRTYTFQLRSGLRFSDGTRVRPEDFRASIERVVRFAAGQAPSFYDGILGASGCSPRRCDLSAGIETGAAARTITIRLRDPDREFAHKLALPLGYVLPARAPAALMRAAAAPGTGPYTIAAFAPARGVRLVRSPRFRSWSAAARPDGFADAIDVTFSNDAAAQVRAVQHGRADALLTSGVFSGELPLDANRALELTDASHVRTGPAATTNWLFVNVRERPFDDVRVRRALNYALDRRRIVDLAGGSGLASLSCQVVPPGLPGYAPTCPFTRNASAGGGWSAPDLVRARRLVTASGSRGARVEVWGLPKYAAVARYTGTVLRRLGYRARVRIRPLARYFTYVGDPRHHVQVAFTGWVADFLTPSSFFEPFTCAQVPRDSGAGAGENSSQFCDRAVDADYAAAQAAGGTEANLRWAALDRRVVAASPAIPLFNRRSQMLVSDRVGNAPMHLQLGPLLDQFWVR